MDLLNVTEASIQLGITKELLFAYIRNAPKKHIGENRKLNSVVKDGQNYFTNQELESFDIYLKTPWSKPNEPRPPIPSYIKSYLEVEIGGKCPISSKGYPLENAHIVDYSISLSHHHHNLIRISKEEHTKVDNGVIEREILKKTKTKLIERLRNSLKNEQDKYRHYPPNPNSLYIGRVKNLIELTAAMEVERMVVIQGIGGIGKTQLLLQALKNVRYHNPVIWIDVESIENFKDFLIILNNASSQYLEIDFSKPIPSSLKDLQVTLIFDSLEKLLISERDKTEDFIRNILNQSNAIQILITSQIDLSIIDFQKKLLNITQLDQDESKLLMSQLIEDDKIVIPDSEFAWFIEFCNGHPLSLKLVVSLIKFYKSSKRAIAYLDKNNVPLHILRSVHTKETSLDRCLQSVYGCLNKEQKDILHYIKYFPSGLKLKWAEEYFKQEAFFENIAILQQFFFIEIITDLLDFERLSISNPIRPYLKNKAKEIHKDEQLKLEKEAIVNIMMEAVIVDLHYIESGLKGPQSYGLMRMDEELPNLLEALSIAKVKSKYYRECENLKITEEYLRIVTGISGSLGKFCFNRGYFEYGLLFSSAGIEANLELKQYEQASSQYVYLAQIQSRLFDFDALKETIKKLEELSNQTNNKSVTTNFLWTKGRLEFDLNKYDEARILFTEASKLLEELHQDESLQREGIESQDIIEAVSRNNIGNICILKFEIAKTYEFNGEFEKAISLHRDVISTLGKFYLGEDIASNFHHLAHCLCSVGEFEEGFDYYYKAIEGFKNGGQFEYLANSISDLGIFVERHPHIVKNPILDENIYLLALESLSEQILRIPGIKNNSFDFNTIPIGLVNKILWIIKAISFSNYCFELTKWVLELAEDIPIQSSKPNYLTAILNLAHSVGGVNQWKHDQYNKSKVIKSILQSSLLINGGHDLKSQTRIFYWLAQWMQHSKLDSTATAERLWEQAWESFEN